jgi:uncharacterized protein (DUF302 family)
MQTPVEDYAVELRTSLTFEAAVQRVTELLAEQGFGVLCDIDVQATLKKKLNLDARPYRILGACNPPFAHRALEAEPRVGVFLPCNVVVWDEGPRRVVAAMEPRVLAGLVGSPEVRAVAEEVSARIHRVMENLEREAGGRC